MALPVLLDDALDAHADGPFLRLSLPWIRSLPVAGVRDLAVTIDREPLAEVEVRWGDAWLPAETLRSRDDWWYIQDRLVLRVPSARTDAPVVDVLVSFALEIPYLAAGPSGPLTLRFSERRPLEPGTPHPRAGLDAGRTAA